jgi:hypothetical protein
MDVMPELGYQQIFSLTLEQLSRFLESREHSHLGFEHLRMGVVNLAREKGLIPADVRGGYTNSNNSLLAEPVRQALHECYLRRLVVWGSDKSNPEWPWFNFTEVGRKSLEYTIPQPYDPDGFIDYFRRVSGPVDPVVDECIVETVQDFNNGCYRSAAVMLGCASEKLVLLLIEAFGAAITDPIKKTKYEKDTAKWMIHPKYDALRTRLDWMVAAKKLPSEQAETVGNALPSCFELIRRCRNSAGHPSTFNVDSETLFMNLRIFTEYSRRVVELIQYFASNPADCP